MEIKGKKILITGGAGFIGSHLADILLDYDVDKVIIYDNFIRGTTNNIENALKDKRVELFHVKGDITHTDELDKALKGIDVVFHFASLCLAYCQEYPRAALNVNITGTYNLLEACVNNKIKKIIFASSSSIYGNADYSPMDEKHPFNNKNFYGATKIAGEALFKAFYHKYGIEYLALRFMNVYGPKQDYQGIYVAVIMKIIDQLQNNLPPVINGDGSQSFDFIYVKDVCRACILAMHSNLSDQHYNISSGIQTSVLELCKKIMQLMNKEDIKILFNPTNDTTLVTNRIGSTLKALNELNFSTEVSLEQGLKEVIKWKKSQTNF